MAAERPSEPRTRAGPAWLGQLAAGLGAVAVLSQGWSLVASRVLSQPGIAGSVANMVAFPTGIAALALGLAAWDGEPTREPLATLGLVLSAAWLLLLTVSTLTGLTTPGPGLQAGI